MSGEVLSPSPSPSIGLSSFDSIEERSVSPSESVDSASGDAVQRVSASARRAITEGLLRQGDLLGEGKAKRVYTTRGAEDEGFVLITHQPGSPAARREIRQEYQMVQWIIKKLFKSDLLELCRQRALPIADAEAERITEQILEIYEDGVLPEDRDVALRNLTPCIGAGVAELVYQHRRQFYASRNHLALSLREVQPAERVDRQYTLASPRATGDLERILAEQRETLSLQDRLDYAKQVVQGFLSLHRAGVVHGDPKPDNVLYVEGNLVLADFGKTASPHGGLHTGNLRYVAPELACTFKGEVFSAALLMIRILEDGFLTKERSMLASVMSPKHKPSAGRQGIEQFLIMNPACPHNESTVSSRIGSFFSKIVSVSGREGASLEIRRYIGALAGSLLLADIPAGEVRKLVDLLQSMTAANPAARPTMAEVRVRLNQIQF